MMKLFSISLFVTFFICNIFAQNKYSQFIPKKDFKSKKAEQNFDKYFTKYQNGLYTEYNIFVKNGDQGIFSLDKKENEILTRQIPNANLLYKKCVKSIVLVATTSGFGAGVIVGNNEIITNYHVVEGAKTAKYILYSPNYTTISQLDPNKVQNADVLAVDKTRDLALIKPLTPIYNISYHTVLNKKARISIADDVFAIGHPQGLIWSYTQGVVSGLPSPFEWNYDERVKLSANCIQTQTPINPGNSGGGLFNLEGNLIGINSMGYEAQGLNFAIKIDEVIDFLSKARLGKYPPVETTSEWVEIFDHGIPDVNSIYGKDTNGNGQMDTWVVFADEDDLPDLMMSDINNDGSPDAALDLALNEWYVDENYDGTFDVVGYDNDGDGEPDEFKPYIK